MKKFIFVTILNIVFETCLCQDIKGFIMQKYEEWFSCNDTIYSPGIYEFNFRIKDITLGRSKSYFFNSIKAVDVSLDYPSVSESRATAKIQFDSNSLFLHVAFNEKCQVDDDSCCHCEDLVIGDAFRHLNNDSNQIEWQYRIIGIYDSDGQSFDIEMNEYWHYMYNPATVLDKDGYVNVRAEKSDTSNVVDTIKVGEVIFYTPSVKSNWW